MVEGTLLTTSTESIDVRNHLPCLKPCEYYSTDRFRADFTLCLFFKFFLAKAGLLYKHTRRLLSIETQNTYSSVVQHFKFLSPNDLKVL